MNRESQLAFGILSKYFGKTRVPRMSEHLFYAKNTTFPRMKTHPNFQMKSRGLSPRSTEISSCAAYRGTNPVNFLATMCPILLPAR